jgi:hypothetical protein
MEIAFSEPVVNAIILSRILILTVLRVASTFLPTELVLLDAVAQEKPHNLLIVG